MPPPRKPHASGRSGTGGSRYRRNRAILLARNRTCWLCGHDGASTADHVISAKLWPRDFAGRKLPGFDELPNLAPAHGTMGNTGLVNRCATCGRACNQVRGARVATSRPQSRVW